MSVTSALLLTSTLLIKGSILSFPCLDFINLLETKSYIDISKTLKTKVWKQKRKLDSTVFKAVIFYFPYTIIA